MNSENQLIEKKMSENRLVLTIVLSITGYCSFLIFQSFDRKFF
jgi:hypothetical protein